MVLACVVVGTEPPMIKLCVREWKGPKFDWKIDVRVKLSDCTWQRAKKGFNGTEKQARTEGNRFAFEIRDRAEHDLTTGMEPKKEVPTLSAFVSRFTTEHLEANRLKPTTIDTYEYRLRLHLLPKLGHLKIDKIDKATVQALKAELSGLSATALNHTLGVLSKVLVFACDAGLIPNVPFRLKAVKVKTTTPEMEFYDFPEFEALVAAAARSSPQDLGLVLLGGEAGLRRGEIAALDWIDVNLAQGVVTVVRNLNKGRVTLPKSGESRKVPMTKRLKAALSALAATGSKEAQVVRKPDGTPHSETSVNEAMPRITRAAGMKESRRIHILRHTFCSHLAMRGAQAIQIMGLAGHSDIMTTQRYMHLSPAMKDSAIRLLDQPIPEGAMA
jgi:integrase